MQELLAKLKGYRTVAVVLLGLAPGVAEYLGAVDLDNGVAQAIATGALAVAGILRLFTNTTAFKKTSPAPAPEEVAS